MVTYPLSCDFYSVFVRKNPVFSDLFATYKEDAQKMRAKDLHEMLLAWENYHRTRPPKRI